MMHITSCIHVTSNYVCGNRKVSLVDCQSKFGSCISFHHELWKCKQKDTFSILGEGRIEEFIQKLFYKVEQLGVVINAIKIECL